MSSKKDAADYILIGFIWGLLGIVTIPAFVIGWCLSKVADKFGYDL